MIAFLKIDLSIIMIVDYLETYLDIIRHIIVMNVTHVPFSRSYYGIDTVVSILDFDTKTEVSIVTYFLNQFISCPPHNISTKGH